MNYILCLDLSLSNTGIVVFDEYGNWVKLQSIDTHKDEGHPLKLKHIADDLIKIKKKYKPSLVVIEQGFTRFNRSTQALYKVHGLVNYLFSDVEQLYYASTSVRKKVLGKGNVNKKELQDFINQEYPEVPFDDLDQSDAFALGLCYFKEKRSIVENDQKNL